MSTPSSCAETTSSSSEASTARSDLPGEQEEGVSVPQGGEEQKVTDEIHNEELEEEEVYAHLDHGFAMPFYVTEKHSGLPIALNEQDFAPLEGFAWFRGECVPAGFKVPQELIPANSAPIGAEFDYVFDSEGRVVVGIALLETGQSELRFPRPHYLLADGMFYPLAYTDDGKPQEGYLRHPETPDLLVPVGLQAHDEKGEPIPGYVITMSGEQVSGVPVHPTAGWSTHYLNAGPDSDGERSSEAAVVISARAPSEKLSTPTPVVDREFVTAKAVDSGVPILHPMAYPAVRTAVVPSTPTFSVSSSTGRVPMTQPSQSPSMTYLSQRSNPLAPQSFALPPTQPQPQPPIQYTQVSQPLPPHHQQQDIVLHQRQDILHQQQDFLTHQQQQTSVQSQQPMPIITQAHMTRISPPKPAMTPLSPETQVISQPHLTRSAIVSGQPSMAVPMSQLPPMTVSTPMSMPPPPPPSRGMATSPFVLSHVPATSLTANSMSSSMPLPMVQQPSIVTIPPPSLSQNSMLRAPQSPSTGPFVRPVPQITPGHNIFEQKLRGSTMSGQPHSSQTFMGGFQQPPPNLSRMRVTGQPQLSSNHASPLLGAQLMPPVTLHNNPNVIPLSGGMNPAYTTYSASVPAPIPTLQEKHSLAASPKIGPADAAAPPSTGATPTVASISRGAAPPRKRWGGMCLCMPPGNGAVSGRRPELVKARKATIDEQQATSSASSASTSTTSRGTYWTIEQEEGPSRRNVSGREGSTSAPRRKRIVGMC